MEALNVEMWKARRGACLSIVFKDHQRVLHNKTQIIVHTWQLLFSVFELCASKNNFYNAGINLGCILAFHRRQPPHILCLIRSTILQLMITLC